MQEAHGRRLRQTAAGRLMQLQLCRDFRKDITQVLILPKLKSLDSDPVGVDWGNRQSIRSLFEAPAPFINEIRAAKTLACGFVASLTE